MSTIDMPFLARLARCAQQQGDHYLYCRTLPILAPHATDATEWLLGYVRSLAALGLNAAAGQFLDRMNASGELSGVVDDLRRAVENKPTGMVAWSARRRRFNANVEALADRCPESANMVRRAREQLAERFELHLCGDGNAQVRPVGDPWPPRWLGGLDDHKSLAPGRVNTQCHGIVPPSQLFDGVGLGWEIFEGYQKTHRVFLESSAALYVVEPNPESIAIIFHIHDFRELLNDSRVRFFVGSNCVNQLHELLESDTTWPITDRVCRSQWLVDKFPSQPLATMRNVADARLLRANELREHLSNVYAGRDAEWWAGRFADAVDEQGKAVGRPLRIMGLTSRHTTFLQYSMRDCLESLESLGHETRLVIEPADHLVLDPSVVLQAQADFEPDVVLLLSRMRYEMTALIHEAIPSVTWDQDALPWVFDEKRNPKLAWNDFLMGFSAATAAKRFGWPEERLLACPMAGGASAYDGGELSEKELEPYRCDVSYVSHASATPSEEANHAEQWLPDGPLRELFRHTLAMVLSAWESGGPFPGNLIIKTYDATDELNLHLDYNDIAKVLVALGRVGDRAFRHVALLWVSDWAQRTNRRFNIWGNGWDKHPSLSIHACGATQNGNELRRVYQASTINLQLMGYGFLHQRALDGLMASGFFMSRRSASDEVRSAMESLLSLLDDYEVACVDDFKRLPKSIQDEIEKRLLPLGADYRALHPELLSGWRSACALPQAMDLVPRFDEVSFTDALDFETKAKRFLVDKETRRRQVADSREMVLKYYSYQSRMVQMMRLVANGFSRSPVEETADRAMVAGGA